MKILTELLSGEAITPEQRSVLRASIKAPVKLCQLISIISGVLDQQKYFPSPWEDAKPGQLVREGGVIELSGPQQYVYKNQRSRPNDPTVVAEKIEKVFGSAEEAVRYYLRWDLHLPGKLDILTIVE